jgi:hypothetical protein
MKVPGTVVSLALLALAAVAAAAEDSQPIAIYAQPVAESPFKLSVPAARLVYGDEGGPALAFDLKITNTRNDRLVATSGWSLDVSSPQGELLQRVHLASGVEIEPLQTRTLSYRLGAATVGSVNPGSRLVIRPASAGVRDITASLCLDSVTCEQAQYGCAQWCGNTLTPPDGVALFECACGRQWDAGRKCWRETCQSHCLCNSRPTPPMDDPFVPWPGH